MDYFWNILASQDSSELLWLLALAAVKATLLVAFAALVSLTLRRLSAATRHLLWASTLCAALLLPFLSFLNVLEVPIFPARAPASDVSVQKESSASEELRQIGLARGAQDAPRPSRTGDSAPGDFKPQLNPGPLDEPLLARSMSATTAPAVTIAPSILPRLVNWTLAVWAAAALLLMIRLAVGLAATALLARRAVEFKDPALNRLFSSLLAEVKLKSRVRLLRSDRTSMPVVCGLLRPAVLLPAEAEGWTEEQRRLVLLHELMHVARRDCLTQVIAQVACAVYWFNPLIWSAARRLRVERERACDDYVLSAGTKPSDYAHHLLEVARSMQERSVFKWSQTASVAMARRSQLEGRLLAILSKEKKHGAVSRAATAGLLALVSMLLVSLALVRPTAISAHDSAKASDGRKSVGEQSSLLTRQEQNWHSAAQGAEAVSQENIDADGGPQQQGSARQGIEDAELSVEPLVEPPAGPGVPPLPALLVPQPGDKELVGPGANHFVGPENRLESDEQEGGGDYIDEMASAGYTNLSVDDLIRLKSSGVTADYVKSLRALGFTNLTPKELMSLANNGVTAAFIKSIRAAGYADLTLKELASFSVHDITPEYIKALRDAGYGNLPAKQLISFAVNEITPAFISGIHAAGYNNLSAQELVSLRVHDITPDFIRKARSRLGALTVRQLVSLKNSGVMGDDEEKE